MMKYLEYLKNPIIAGIIGGMIIIIFALIDAKINKRKFEQYYYHKVFVVVFILVGTIVYISKSDNKIMKQLGGNNIRSGGGMNESMASSLSMPNRINDIYTNMPDF